MPSGIYQSPNRRGGVKGRSGVYPKSEEHRKRISETLKRKGIKPPITITRYWFGKHRSKETKKKISLGMMGRKISEKTRKKMGFKKEKHWHWKKDRTKLVKNEKKHLDGRYREWAYLVKQRDNWQCQLNNQDCKGRLESHHILSWKDYPELRYELRNGITLCQFHHPRSREDEKRLILIFQRLVEVREIIWHLYDIEERPKLCISKKEIHWLS